MRIFPGELFQGPQGLTLVIADSVEIKFSGSPILMTQYPLDIAEAGPSLVQHLRLELVMARLIREEAGVAEPVGRREAHRAVTLCLRYPHWTRLAGSPQSALPTASLFSPTYPAVPA